MPGQLRPASDWAGGKSGYPKVVACLVKDCGALLAFYNFPATHWQLLRIAGVKFVDGIDDKKISRNTD